MYADGSPEWRSPCLIMAHKTHEAAFVSINEATPGVGFLSEFELRSRDRFSFFDAVDDDIYHEVYVFLEGYVRVSMAQAYSCA